MITGLYQYIVVTFVDKPHSPYVVVDIEEEEIAEIFEKYNLKVYEKEYGQVNEDRTIRARVITVISNCHGDNQNQ